MPLQISRVWAHLVGESEEHIYGGGEQYTYLDLKVSLEITREAYSHQIGFSYRVATIPSG